MQRLSKRKFSLLEVVGLLAAVILSVGLYAYAVTLPHTFTAGTTAVADEVNENFQALEEAVNEVADAVGARTPSSCAGNSAVDIMVPVGPLCVDKYEASVWSLATGTGTQYGATSDNYPAGFPDTGNWSTPLYAVSKPGVTPSRHITWFQAQQACALSGKRLLTNAEWQMAAAGTPDNINCNVNGAGPVATGSKTGCVSNWDVNDMVGNVWEWVGDWMQGPDADPITAGDQWDPDLYIDGIAAYGSDLMPAINEARFMFAGLPAALSRGGAYDNVAGAGVFAITAEFDAADSWEDKGFRCAR